MGRYQRFISLLAFSMMILGLTVVASAQYRDRRGDNGYYGNQNIKSNVKSLRNQARQFEKTLDRELDRSRINGSQREDNLNNLAERFKDAAEDFEDKYDDRRDQRGSASYASRVMVEATRLDNALSSSRIGRNNNTISQSWNAIEQNLNVISRAYNINYNGRYGRNGNWGGNDDRNDRNGRNGNWGGNGNRRYNDRNLGPTISSLKAKARDLEDRLDRDQNRRSGNNLENLSDRFKNAVDDLADEYRDRDDAYNEAQKVLRIGEQLDREMSGNGPNRNIRNEWRSIERDLQTIARAYNLSYNSNNGNRGGRWSDILNLPF